MEQVKQTSLFDISAKTRYSQRRGYSRIQDGDLHFYVNIKKGAKSCYIMTVNKKDAAAVQSYQYMDLYVNDVTDELLMVFNNEKGWRVNNNKVNGMRFAIRSLVEIFIERFGIVCDSEAPQVFDLKMIPTNKHNVFKITSY